MSFSHANKTRGIPVWVKEIESVIVARKLVSVMANFECRSGLQRSEELSGSIKLVQ